MDGGPAFEELIAGTTAGFFALTAALYERAGYYGHVDIGVAIACLKGAHGGSSRGRFGFAGHAYAAETFTKTARVSAAELAFVQDRTRDPLGRFFEASGDDGYDPSPHSRRARAAYFLEARRSDNRSRYGRSRGAQP